MSTSHLALRNPHSVLAAIQERPKDVIKIMAGEGWAEVIAAARKANVRVEAPSRDFGRDSRPGGRVPELKGRVGGRMGGYEAWVRPRQPVALEALWPGKPAQGLWLALDCLQDPQNVGAIFRTAAFFGVKGLVLTEERSAPMSGTVYDVASGGVEHVPYAVQTNLQRAFESAKDAGLWVLGSSERGAENLASVPRDRAWLLVLGNEEQGMRRLTEERCDLVCRVPHAPGAGVGSLNVASAASILIHTLASG